MRGREATRAALLQALFAGPADSVALAGFVARRVRGGPRISSPEIVRSLRELVRQGTVRTWRGPSRTASAGRAAFYELTAVGVAEVESLRAELEGFAGAGTTRARQGSEAVDRGLERSLEISAVVGALRRRGGRSASRR